MHIFILADMEGCSGICRAVQVYTDGRHYAEGRRQMTADVNAAVRGCLDGGATRITVRDVHATTDNLIYEELAEGAEYILGSSRFGRMPGIETCDGVILLGYHAMAGTPLGVLEHTSSAARWQNCWVNGVKAGEILIDAATAGEQGVPVILVTGDDHTAREVHASLGEDVPTVQVKRGLDIEGAILLPPGEARRRIRDGARDAVRNCHQRRPLELTSPITLRLELVSRGPLPRSAVEVTIIDGRTFEVTAPTMREAVLIVENAMPMR